MAREYTTKLLEWADDSGEWETLARLCLEWLSEYDVKEMEAHHGILDQDDSE